MEGILRQATEQIDVSRLQWNDAFKTLTGIYRPVCQWLCVKMEVYLVNVNVPDSLSLSLSLNR